MQKLFEAGSEVLAAARKARALVSEVIVIEGSDYFIDAMTRSEAD